MEIIILSIFITHKSKGDRAKENCSVKKPGHFGEVSKVFDVCIIEPVLGLFDKLDNGSGVDNKDMNSVKSNKAWVVHFLNACNTEGSSGNTIKVGKVIRVHKELEIEGLIKRIVIKV
jgi:cobyrinic acid a,c-diamide synthase